MRALAWLSLTSMATTMVAPPGEVEIQRPKRIEAAPAGEAPAPTSDPVEVAPVEVVAPAQPQPVAEGAPTSAASPASSGPPVAPVAPLPPPAASPVDDRQRPPLRGAGLWISGAFATGLGGYVLTELALSDPFGGKGLLYGGAGFLTVAGAGAFAGGTVLYVRHRRWTIENMGAPPHVEAGMPLMSTGMASLGVGFPMLIFGAFGNLSCQPEPFEELVTESCFRGPRTRMITGATLSGVGLVLTAVGAFYSFRHKRALATHSVVARPFVAPSRFGMSAGLSGRF